MPDYSRQRLYTEVDHYPNPDCLERKVLRCFNAQPHLIGHSGDSTRPMNYSTREHFDIYERAVCSDFQDLMRDLGFIQRDEAKVIYANCWKLFRGEGERIVITAEQRKAIEDKRIEERKNQDNMYGRRLLSYPDHL